MKTESGTRGPRAAFGVLAVIAFSMTGLSACSPDSPGGATGAPATPIGAPATPSPASAAATAVDSVPPSLAAAGESAENIYDYAKANDWKNADARLAALNATVKELRTLTKKGSAEETRLEEDVPALDRAVIARDRIAAMRAANQVTRDVAEMTATYTPLVPVEVTRLDYYGRELEIWAEAGNADKLKATARAMRRGWDSVRGAVEARSTTEAAKFDALVAQVEKAQTPAEFARLAKPVLDEADNLEKVFHP